MSKQIRMAGSPAAYQTVNSDYSAQATFTPAAAAYGAGDIMEGAKAFAFGQGAAGELKITGYNFMIEHTALVASEAAYRLHLYNAAPAVLADNAAYDLAVADRLLYLGYIDIDAPTDWGNTVYGEKIFSVPKQITVPASGTVYGFLQTVAGITATAAIRRVTLKAEAV